MIAIAEGTCPAANAAETEDFLSVLPVVERYACFVFRKMAYKATRRRSRRRGCRCVPSFPQSRQIGEMENRLRAAFGPVFCGTLSGWAARRHEIERARCLRAPGPSTWRLSPGTPAFGECLIWPLGRNTDRRHRNSYSGSGCIPARFSRLAENDSTGGIASWRCSSLGATLPPWRPSDSTYRPRGLVSFVPGCAMIGPHSKANNHSTPQQHRP